LPAPPLDATDASQTPGPAPPRPGGVPRIVASELTALGRIATFRRTDGAAIVGHEASIALLAALSLLMWVVIDPLLHARDLVFSWYAVPDLVCIAAGAFVLPWLLRIFGRIEYRRALVLTLGALPLAMAGEIASWKLSHDRLYPLLGVLAVYGLCYFTHGLRTLTGHHQPRALIAGVLATALFVLSLDFLQANPRLWVRAEERLDSLNATGIDWARMARIQFLQQSRIDADVAALAPQRPEVTDVFFLGFAGYGQERIFARDIDLAAGSVAARYDTRGRSVRLINDHQDIETWPIATEPGLRHALRRLGDVMGPEDVLFLALSSHGVRGQGVRVTNAGMVPTVLSAEQLGEMLRDAGIAWRIVVVSACYSGDFVDTLADERSMVIAAASADRKSFGCNDSRNLTYFGEAFYREAMASRGPMQEAFETARAALERKERAEGILPSQPRASFGALASAHLQGR
jgi:Peptidase C13 family